MRIEGNTHAPAPNGSAVLLIAGDGIILSANEFGDRTKAAASTNVALVEIGSDGSLFQTSNVFMKANTGFTAVSEAGELTNRGLVRLLPTTQPFNQGVGLHTWVNEDTGAERRPYNLIGGNRDQNPHARETWTKTDGACTVQQPDGSSGQ